MEKKIGIGKKALSLALALIMVLGMVPPVFAESNPDSEDYTIITTAEQLDAIRKNLKGKYRLDADIDLTDYVSSTNTAAKGWSPIGVPLQASSTEILCSVIQDML